MEDKNYNNEIDINIKDIVFFLLKRWRSLLIMVVIGAVIGTGVYGIQKKKFEKSAQVEAVELQQQSLIAAGLDKRSIEKINMANEYYSLYQQQLEYMNNNLFAKFDIDHMYVGEMQCYVAAGKNTPKIKNYYSNIIKEDTILEEIRAVIDRETDVKYIRDILNAQIADEHGISGYMGQEETMGNAAIITYSVWYDDEDVIQNIFDILNQRIYELNKELTVKFGSYEQDLMGCYIQAVKGTDFLSYKKMDLDILQNYIVSALTIQGQMTEKESDYFERYCLNKESNTAVKVEQFEESLVKWAGLGVVAMCFCWGVCWLILYFLSGSVKCADEIVQKYNLDLLGYYAEETEKKKGFDKFLSKLKKRYYISGDPLEYIVQSIAFLNGEKKCICFDANCPRERRLAEKITEHFHGNLWHMPYEKPEYLVKARESDGVILIVELEHTLKTDVRKFVKVCNGYGIKILGIIIVE